VIFQGGPLTFNPTLIKVFQERLGLSDQQCILPDNPEIFVAMGAAFALDGSLSLIDRKDVQLDLIIDKLRTFQQDQGKKSGVSTLPLFADDQEREDFARRHELVPFHSEHYPSGTILDVYLGIDAGSTTTKMVLIDQDEKLIDTFYANNSGDPLAVARGALEGLRDKWSAQGVKLNILGMGSTGYGEQLFAKAFGADYHTVETVSHARSAMKYAPNVDFILDIGGQDMKAISLSGGIVTGIVLNEACSAGCGSFLENFAHGLGVEVKDIAPLAAESTSPSRLGSRCTVFMTSSIITEQKNGKTTEDILAGLCRSIVENVFTKVVRVSNLDQLGTTILVQGGTFRNDAVLRALEQYTGKQVVRAPYPGEMGAIGIALLTMEKHKEGFYKESHFIGLERLDEFGYKKTPGLICPFCSNNCNRTVVEFSSGQSFITGNRCERGEILGEAADPETKKKVKATLQKMQSVPNMLKIRNTALFRKPEVNPLSPPKDFTIGIPRVLEFYNSLPFWRGMFESLGFKVVVSKPSTMKMFEDGLSSIPSDTVCFPAKLVHGHILDLVEKKVDRIFFPIMNRLPPENIYTSPDHVCAVVKGYPMVVKENMEPEAKHGIPVDSPTFHWLDDGVKKRSLRAYISQTFGLPRSVIDLAVKEGDKAQNLFQEELLANGQKILQDIEGTDRFAVVVAGRPYHADPLINHRMAELFTAHDIPVLTLDSLPGLETMDVRKSRAEATINFHTRMLAGAMFVAENPNLEYAQIVSFGCGHDAILTDEIIRILKEQAEKDPLVLKLDESDAMGPLRIRVNSFVETLKAKRAKGIMPEPKPLSDPFKVKFDQKAAEEKTILIPNVSEAFARVTSAVMRGQGYKTMALPLADERALALGKKYVHNDMCFPAQINIGEALAVLESGEVDPDKVVCGLAKDHCDCRLAQYAMMARRALDDAGYPQVPIATTGKDTKDMHPAFNLGIKFEYRMLWIVAITDVLEELRRKIRPYETQKGMTDKVFDKIIGLLEEAIAIGTRKAIPVFEEGIEMMKAIPVDRSSPRPKVFVIGEFLLNFHPSSNYNIEEYLEDQGMEVVMPSLQYNFHREYIREQSEMYDFHVQKPIIEAMTAHIGDGLFKTAIRKVNKIASRHPLFEVKTPLEEVAKGAMKIIDKTFTSGEGWMIAGEIIEHAKHGVENFLILQPFGCLPNHVTGRGLVKRLKKEIPTVQILALDYDPDTSMANVENRLQMLIIGAKERLAKQRAQMASVEMQP
jgi:predicted CoA-substrate-specific enzyme activase